MRLRLFFAVAFIGVISTSQGLFAQVGGFEPTLLRGDANNDGVVNPADSQFLGCYLYQGGSAPLCADAADFDDNGLVASLDLVYLNWFLYNGGAAPQQPFPYCGKDPTPDSLSCVYSHCDSD